MTRWRLTLIVLLLQIPGLTLSAGEKRLASGHVPAVVAHRGVLAQGRVPATNQMRLALSLPLRHTVELTNLLAALYNPASPQYRHFLTPRQFAARFGPTPADYAAVMKFASTNGLQIKATHPNRLLLDVTGPAADVERALHVKLQSFRHPTEPRNFFAPDSEPTVDAAVPLFHVSGLDNFSRRHPNAIVRPAALAPRLSANGGSSPYGTFMGNDFRQAYVPGTALTGAGQNVCLLQFDGFNFEDITNYASAIGLTNLPQITVVPVDGGIASPGGGIVEVELDIEMVLAMSPGVSNIYVYEAPNPSPWIDILSQMANDNFASQMSCSWSGGGPDPASEQVFLQMAAQGISFFNATGDSAAFTGPVDFPSASPSITQVGGTFLNTDTNGDYLSEIVWNRGDGLGSSGGIGLGERLPGWQLGLDLTANGGSAVWRNLPDVALTAENIYVITSGQEGLAAGTSCAAPLWAALAALINEQGAQWGQPPVGFLNPAIYSLGKGTNYAAVFHDITNGNNTNLDNTVNYYAVPGFDLCTGWGTPSGTNLINALLTPDFLGIQPTNFFCTGRFPGLPFPQTNWIITLTNGGTGNLDWSLSSAPAWLTFSTAGGTLAANDSTNVGLQLVNPEAMPVGNYRAVLSVTNEGLSRVQNVVVQVEVALLQNGGFESGDFSGWTLVGDTVDFNHVYNVVATEYHYPGLAHSGEYGAFLGQSDYAATLSQTLITVPGQQYVVSWWLDNPVGGSIQSFSASWNGVNFVSLVDPSEFAWTNLQFAVMADDTNAILQFAAENDTRYFGLDDVRVVPVPAVSVGSCSVCTNGFQFTWQSQPGLNYLVQCSTNLAEGAWQTLGTMTAVTNVSSFADTNYPANTDQRFYRIQLVVP